MRSPSETSWSSAQYYTTVKQLNYYILTVHFLYHEPQEWFIVGTTKK